MEVKKSKLPKTPPFPIALLAGLVIVLLLAAMILNAESKLGFTSGWIIPMVLAVFIGAAVPRDGINPKSIASVLLGAAFAIIAGQFFVIFVPVFIACAVVTIVCVITKKARIVLNDYALIFITVYTIKGVPDISRIYQDYIMLAVVAVILIIICVIVTKISKKSQAAEEEPLLPGRVKVKDQWAPLPEGYEKASYAKYLMDIDPVAPEIKEQIEHGEKDPLDGLDPNDRRKLQETECWPKESGFYRLKSGGMLVASNVKVPDITGEMIAWWASWHSLDPLRYALWDPEDHYDVQVSDYGRQRALDPNIPVDQRLWGSTHSILEAFDRDAPDKLTMTFLDPGEAGFDMSLWGTPQCEYLLCAKSTMGGKIPVFVAENFCRDENGVMEVRLRFWIGYDLQEDGSIKCKIPKFIKIPEEKGKLLMTHNFKEYAHLNKFLPQLYAEEKDHWEVSWQTAGVECPE